MLYVKKRISLVSVVVGALVFLVFQLLTRIPLLAVLGTQPWYQQMAENIVLIGLFLSLTAGLFEEIGRYLAFRFVLKSRLQIKNGVAYGVGHGGFEAMALVGLTYVNNPIYSTLINSGQYDTLIAPMLGELGDTLRDRVVNTPAYALPSPVWSGCLRSCAYCAVAGGAARRAPGRFVYVIYAILLHTLLNFRRCSCRGWSMALSTRRSTCCLCVGAFLFIRRIWRQYEHPEPVEAGTPGVEA